ncbi:unnamed protein product [Penicillium glandicola]
MSLFGEAPSGTDLSASRGSLNYAPAVATYAVAVLSVALRFYTRFRVQGVRIAADDLMIVAGLLAVTAGLVLIIIVSGYHGLGRHVWSIPGSEVTETMRILFIFVLFYIITAPIIKLSIILLYRRIFGMTYAIWLCVILSVGYFCCGTIILLVCCTPVSYYWTQFTDASGGKCRYSLYPLYLTLASVNMATDVLILAIPIPIVWKLQIRRPQKILLSGIFLVGGFVCIASLVRIYYITFLASHDYTWHVGEVFIWSSIEPSIAILCACLPTLHPLFRLVISRLLGTDQKGYVAQEPLHDPESAGKKTKARTQRPLDWDETLLTTHDVQVEMSGLRRDNTEDGQIMVDMDFRIVEENNQLK